MFSFGSIGSFPILLADVTSESVTGTSSFAVLGGHLLAAVVFSMVGIAVLCLCFWLMHRLSPFSIVKEIEQDHNTALAIVMAAVIIGISMIIAAAIMG